MSLRDHPNCQMRLDLGAAECQWRPQSYFMNCLHFIFILFLQLDNAESAVEWEWMNYEQLRVQNCKWAINLVCTWSSCCWMCDIWCNLNWIVPTLLSLVIVNVLHIWWNGFYHILNTCIKPNCWDHILCKVYVHWYVCQGGLRMQ
jgi:hypothetical protein